MKMIITDVKTTVAMAVRRPKATTEWCATNQKREVKQKFGAWLKFAMRKLARRSMSTIDRQIETLYFPLGANGFFRRALMATSAPKTNWVYGTMKTATGDVRTHDSHPVI
jgi:hypothetical protein